MTSSLLSLQPFMTFILKWKSFPFSLHDESLPTCPNVFFNYRSLHCLDINPSNQFFPFQSVSSHGQMKHLEGTQARGQNFLRYLDFLPGDVSLYKPYRYVPPQRVWFLRFFCLLKRIYTLLILVWNRVWFSRELPECKNALLVFVVSIPNE